MENEQRKLWLAYKINSYLSPLRKDPKIFRLNLNQLDYVNFTLLKSSYLKACPGSGKTEVVGLKSAYAINRWSKRHSGIAVLSFTRNAAKEIKERVFRYAGPEAARYPHFVGTFDSWLHNFIFQPFAANEMGYAGKNGDKRIRIIDNELKGYFMFRYCTSVAVEKKRKQIWVNEYFYLPTGGIEGTVEGKLNKYPPHIMEKLKQKKKEFFSHGYATYQDAAYLSYLLLKENGNIAQIIAGRFPYIIIDECQDLCYNQLMMLFYLYKAGMQIHLIGDVNQSIYEFRKVSPEKLNGFIDEIKPVPKELTTNYRSNQCIVDACCKFIGEKKGIGNEKQRNCSPLVLWQFEKGKQSDPPERFRHKLELLADPEISYKKSAVLVRGRGLLGQISSQKKSTGEYVDDFLQAVYRWHLKQKTTNDIDFSLRIMGKILCRLAYNGKGRHMDQYCPDCFDSIKWRYFIAGILDSSAEVHSEIFNQADMTISQCTLILKKFIESIWERFPSAENTFDDIRLKIRVPKKRGDELVALNPGNSEDSLRMTTIHDVKGETLDAVLLISTPDGRGKNGGFYKDWLEPDKGDEEFQRFAYVAFSRPKHLLVVATPRLTGEYVKKFQELGFVEEDIP